ncbi:peptide deformylase [Melioribacteraceae bacterium 4301-Me]|uniref:peptide deformylase n=1 Tax=Pyranulibacter aquaticus TaxID=3163344 RepID=UPI0035960C4F
MAIIPITVYGDKILRQKTKKINQIDDEIIVKIKDMFETMHNAHGIGLAANQVGFNESIFVVDLSQVEGYEKIKPVVMINPEIIEESPEKVVMEEGCLSLPLLKAEVERSQIIKVKFIDTDENEQTLEADELFARVILHEYDHLQGKMIPDRVTPDVKKKLQAELKKIMNREIKIDYPITQK